MSTAAGVMHARAAPRGDPLALTAEVYLALLPASQILALFVAGAVASAADGALVALVLVGGAQLVSRREWEAPGSVGSRPVLTALLLLAAYGVWVGLSALWGPHPGYAGAKAVGVVGLAAGTAVLALGRVPWGRLADAWLVGAALALLLALLGWALGPDALRARVLYGGGAVEGLPLPRVRGPFLHPSMAGDYWAVTGALLWARWPDLHGARRALGVALAAALGLALLLTVSTAWIGAGVGLLLLARSRRVGRAGGVAFRLGGLALVAVGLAGALVPLSLEVGPVTVRTGAIRPTIWASSLAAVAEAPLTGVGAAPYLAQAPDPLDAGVAALWDAHNAYLSLLGQFGPMGLALALGGALLLARALVRTPPSRVRTGLLAALAAVAAHAVFAASEDFRHVWALLGVAGAWVGEGEEAA